MKSRYLVPAIAVSVFGQQTAPVSVKAEKAVRARAEQFYQFELDKHFRQIEEALVANDSKDIYYNSNRPNIKGFRIVSVVLTDNNTRASVTAQVKTEVMFPGTMGPQAMELPAITKWKLEKGQWYWYVAPKDPIDTPFGKVTPSADGTAASRNQALMKIPDVSSLKALVTISSQTVALTQSAPIQSVTISNGMAGPIEIRISEDKIEGVTVEAEKSQINANEKGALGFKLTGKTKVSGVVKVTCSPLGQEFDIRVTAN
ncbi:MAG TPA: hypothetical protein VGM43_05705 [Bryobacteraceae bacterium]|jgi:hypothetical protein